MEVDEDATEVAEVEESRESAMGDNNPKSGPGGEDERTGGEVGDDEEEEFLRASEDFSRGDKNIKEEMDRCGAEEVIGGESEPTGRAADTAAVSTMSLDNVDDEVGDEDEVAAAAIGEPAAGLDVLLLSRIILANTVDDAAEVDVGAIELMDS